jgi:putative FmdB family regulatory protein
MPTYVYECSKCAKVFEAEQRITEDPLTTCLCGAEGTVKRVIQPVGIMFKGSGFYVNDSQSNSSSAIVKSEAPAPTTETTAAPAEVSNSSEVVSAKSDAT